MAYIDERAAAKLATHLALESHRAVTPDMREAIDHLARGFRLLRDLGAPSVDLLDVLGGTLDIVSNIDAERIKRGLRARTAYAIYAGKTDLEPFVFCNCYSCDTHIIEYIFEN
mgnify:CR=1 FL=1